jgi:tetratricopeptide (TPR) repeat protein
MADDQRIESLRRRVEHDRTSIAFAQLAEELRRAGRMQEAVETCRTGLSLHPGYVSARVTLGRALIALDQLDEAQAELERVLRSAPENFAAIRGLADLYRRRGNVPEALTRYRAALSLAPKDPELQQLVATLSHDIEPDGSAEGRLTAAADVYGRQPEPVRSAPPAPPPSPPVRLDAEGDRAEKTIAALEQFLCAIRSAQRLSE